MFENSILEALKFLHPDLGEKDYGVVELCGLGCSGAAPNIWDGFCGAKGGAVAGWFDDRRKILSRAADLDKGWADRNGQGCYPKGVYVTLNPVNDALLGRSNNRLQAGVGRTKDQEVLSYRNLLIDIDEHSAPSDVSATKEEHDVAAALALAVKRWIHENLYWPEPMVCDSGNGGHLVYKTHMPVTKETTALYKDFLRLLDLKFSYKTENNLHVKVDTTVYNPGRITKLYGTMTHKGDATPDRPHRRSYIMQLPDPDKPQTLVTEALLRFGIETLKGQLGEEAEAPATTTRTRPDPRPGPRPGADAMFTSITDMQPQRRGGTLKVEDYLRDNNIIVTEVKPFNDSMLYVLDHCVFDDSHSGGEAAIGQTADGKLFYQCFHDSCKNDPNRRWRNARDLISGDASLGQWMEGGTFGVQFPNVNADGKPYARVENFRALCAAYGVNIRYNQMNRSFEFCFREGVWENADRKSSLARAVMREWCAVHGLPDARMDDWVLLMSEESTYHPVRKWIESQPWDGISRLEELYATIRVAEDLEDQKRVYLKKWLIAAVAALYKPNFACKSVLTFTGVQNVGKTSWFRRLCPEDLCAFGEGMHIDPANKDSLLQFLRYWLVEIGELDATFKKADVSRLKAFLSKNKDEVRPPYGRSIEVWRRQTVCGATVNDPQFLVDATGNVRWWCLEVEEINYTHSVDMQQLWAEAKALYAAGETWFLDEEETQRLHEINSGHEISDPIDEGIQKHYRFDSMRAAWSHEMTSVDVLEAIGMTNINKGHLTRAGIILKKLVGNAVRKNVNGRLGRYYKMPPRRDVHSAMFSDEGDQAKAPGTIIPFDR